MAKTTTAAAHRSEEPAGFSHSLHGLNALRPAPTADNQTIRLATKRIERSAGCARAPEFPPEQPRSPVSGHPPARRGPCLPKLCVDQGPGREFRLYVALIPTFPELVSNRPAMMFRTVDVPQPVRPKSNKSTKSTKNALLRAPSGCPSVAEPCRTISSG